MEWQLFENIIEQVTSEPLVSRVILSLHNEPLLDKRIFDCVEFIESKCPDKYCVVVTNGQLLSQFNLKDMNQSNLDHLVVSVNAHTKAMYEQIGNGLSYDEIMDNVSSLLSSEYLRHKVSLSFVLTGQNLPDVCQAIEYWKAQGVKTRVMKPTNRAGALDNYDHIRPTWGFSHQPSISRAWGRVLSRARSLTGCTYPFYQMNILHNGDCIICCNDWNRSLVVGNVETASLRQIWNSSKMNEVRRLVLKKNYENITSCKECSEAIQTVA
jgi:radical SAM protein with 4Fe4S-binding SPASM domain